MTDLMTLRERLAQAEIAHHQLAMGATVAVVAKDGRRIEYYRTTAGDLWSYIERLRKDVAEAQMVVAGQRPARRRAIGVVFGA